MAHCGVEVCEAPKRVPLLVTTSTPSAIPVPWCGDSSQEGVYFQRQNTPALAFVMTPRISPNPAQGFFVEYTHD